MPLNVVYTAPVGETSVTWGNGLPAVPVAEFFGTPTSGTTPLAVTFTNQSTGAIDSYLWSFGDGTSSTTANPTKAYLSAASFTVALTATGPGGSNTKTRTGYVVSSAPAPGPAPAPAPVGATITSLSAYASAPVTAPYSATVLPLRGTVPSGSTLRSTDDTTLRASILSTHDDGSAAVVVVSGSKTFASGSSTISVQTSTATDTALTAAAISALVSSVSVAFDGGYGTASITDFSSPERVWWANGQTICARYRVAAPTPGTTSLEAIIDIHAYAGRALVEVVVENCKMVTGGVGVATTKPAAASYSAAVVAVNGTTIATLNGNGAPEGNHAAFRALYASTWIGGNPGLRITQSHTDLQKHPLLFKCDQSSTTDLSVYAADTYTPWTNGRIRASGMSAGGDHPGIGPLTQWESRALQSGDYRTWNATEVSTLAALGYGVNYRDSTTGRPQTFAQLKVNNVSQNGYGGGAPQTWPVTAYNGSLGWETAHQPSCTGLMAFVSRPSPVFIELAQKVSVFNGTWTVVTGGPVHLTGVFGTQYEIRARAWCMRALAHATFLTPDNLSAGVADPWKAPARTSIADNVAWLDAYRTDSRSSLKLLWFQDTASITGSYYAGPSVSAHGVAAWMHHYAAVEWHKAASARLVTPGANQTALDTLADWLVTQPVDWINTQSDTAAWRHIPYATFIGRATNTIEPGQTYPTQMDWWFDDAPPATVAGPWMYTSAQSTKTYAGFLADSNPAANPQYYTWYFWSALVAAVERNVAGAATAWAHVQANITGLSSWRAAFGGEPRWGSVPRNVVSWAASLPADTWTALDAGSNFMTWANAGGIPAGAYIGTDPFRATVNAYCDPADDGARYQHFFGGGHGDSSCNAVSTFDWYTLQWALKGTPTPPAKYPPKYGTDRLSWGGSATQPGQLVYPSGLDARPDGFFLNTDVLTDGADTPYATPQARNASHMYGAGALNTLTGKIHYFYGQYAEFDTNTGTWGGRGYDVVAALVAINPALASFIPANKGLTNGSWATFDEVTGKFFVSLNPGDNSGAARSGLFAFEPTTRTVDAIYLTGSGTYGQHLGGETFIKAGRKLYVFTKVQAYYAYDAPLIMKTGYIFDMDTRARQAFTISGGGSLDDDCTYSYYAQQETIPGFFDGTSIHRWNYGDATKRQKLLTLNLTPSSGTGTTADPFVLAQTTRPLTGVPAGTVIWIFKRLMWLPAASCAVLIGDPGQPAYALKVS